MTKAGRDLLLLGLGAALLFSVAAGRRDLWNPSEPTYGQAVTEMAARGDWLVPTVNGRAFAEKPILYYWLALGAARCLGGVNEWTLRLPSVASGVAAVLLVYLLIAPYAGLFRARLAALILSTTFVVFWSARQIQMDLLLCATGLAVVVAASRVLDHGLAPRRGLALAGLAAGCGVLAKGPVGLVVPVLALAPYLVAERRRLTPLLRPAALLIGGGVCVLVAAPWYLTLWRCGRGEILHEMLVRQNFTRFVDPWDHAAPWWYYLAYFFVDMAPFAFFVPLAWGLKAQDESEARLHRLAWGWIAAVVVFFSLSASKRSPYILPVAPAVAVLVSGLACRWIDGRLDRVRAAVSHGLLSAIGAGFTGLGLLLLTTSRIPADDAAIRRAAHMLAATASVAGVSILLTSIVPRWRRRGAPLALLGGLVALYVAGALWALPAANRYKSARPFCDEVARHVQPADALRGFHEWTWRAGYSFYLGRMIPNLESPDELRAYWERPGPVFLIVERGRLEQARRVLGDRAPLAERAIGDNRAYLFSNWPESAGSQDQQLSVDAQREER